MDLRDFFTLKPSPDRDVIQAQMTSNGTITGTVTDPPGAVITGADVTLINAKTNNQATPITKNKSTFVASTVQPGTYTVTVKATDFKQTVVTDVSTPPSINSTLRPVTSRKLSPSSTVVSQSRCKQPPPVLLQRAPENCLCRQRTKSAPFS